MTDHDLLLTIQELLDGVEWSNQTVSDIADLLTENGYRIRDVDDTLSGGRVTMTDPDAHLAGTPWDTWRQNVAVLLGVTPADVSGFPDAYAAFNVSMSEVDYCASVDDLLYPDDLASS